jgi:predicted nucleotidyltransferase
MKSLLDSNLALIIDSLNTLDGLELVYVFGSRADNSAANNSDWDIAVLCKRPLESDERWNMAQSLAHRLDADVDLIDLLQASTVLQMEVISKGFLLKGDQGWADIFATKVFSMYGRLQESRSDIVEQFLDDLKNG